MRVPIPYVAARSKDLGPSENDLCLEVPLNGPPRLAYNRPRPNDRDAHGNLWARMTRVEGGRVEFDCLDPLRQRECMERLLCQVCAQPAERADGTLFIEWQHAEEPPMRLNRIRTDMPPLCPPCVPVSLRHCPFLRRDQSAVLLRARKAVPCGVSGTVYQADLKRDRWVPSEDDVYSSYNAPRFPGMLAARLYSKLRGVTVVDPASLAAELVSTS